MSGLARAREWDATVLVEAPAAGAEELAFRAFPEAIVGADAEVPAVARAAEALDALVDRPYEALLVRRGEGTWAAAARAVAADLVRLPGVQARSLELAAAPGGERLLRVDGEDAPLGVPPPVAAAAAELERRARARFEAYAVTADRVEDDLWDVRVDPL